MCSAIEQTNLHVLGWIRLGDNRYKGNNTITGDFAKYKPEKGKRAFMYRIHFLQQTLLQTMTSNPCIQFGALLSVCTHRLPEISLVNVQSTHGALCVRFQFLLPHISLLSDSIVVLISTTKIFMKVINLL